MPWGREGFGFTLMMGGVPLSLVRHMSANVVAREVGEHDTKLWRTLDHYIEERKKGRKNDTANAFQQKFSTLDGKKENVKDVTSGMYHGYRNSMRKAFPNALLAVNKFHVIKNSSDVVDNLRKREMKSREKRKAMALSRSRYVFLRNPENLAKDHAARLKELQQLEYLDTVVAYDHHMRLKTMYELCGDCDEAACFPSAAPKRMVLQCPCFLIFSCSIFLNFL